MQNQQPMQPYNNGLVPTGYWKRLWYLWGALVIKMIISYATTFMAELVYLTNYAMKYPDKLMEITQNQDAIWELSAQIIEALLPYTTIMEGVAAFVTIPILCLMIRSDYKKERLIGMPRKAKAPLGKYSAIVLISVAMCIGMNNVLFISGLTVTDQSYVKITEALYSADFGVQLLCLGILIPIAEELVFRGLMYRRLRYGLPFKSAAFYTSLAFGIFHGNLVQMIYAFILGMLFSYLYDKYGSIKAPILAHVSMNVVSVFASEMMFMNWMAQEYIRIAGITVVCAFIASSMFVLIQRMEIGEKDYVS